MFRAFSKAFGEAIHNLRVNFFQTILSVLGIIIGVGALVTMLSLIDGLEVTAKERISAETDFENIRVRSKSTRRLDGVTVQRDSIARLTVANLQDLLADLPYAAKGQLLAPTTALVKHPNTDSLLGLRQIGLSLPMIDTSQYTIKYGRSLSEEDQEKASPVININDHLARRLVAEGDSLDAALNTYLTVGEDSLQIVGIFTAGADALLFTLPMTVLEQKPIPPYPEMVISLASVEEVQDAKTFTVDWMEDRYAGIEDPFEIRSQDYWLEELRKGFLLFRIVMGLIVGIAVVVGGVGVMNVLLMSVTERTTEIGIRKAVGANRRKIIAQFLSESVAISFIGSFFGLLLGIGVALIIAPVMNVFVDDLPIRVVFSFRTLLTVGTIAILVGIIFGTYPARRAAKLDPVEAIRRA